jgi:lipoate-protein ligase A
MGLDEAILEGAVRGGARPTLRLYGWLPAAVSIGYFQGLAEEVDAAACAARGIDLVRRITGGGAVFHQDEITYSLVIPESHPLCEGSAIDSYRRICSGVIKGLAILGVESSFAPINDIVSGGKKVSGNAQTRRRGIVLQHGTLLLGLDADLMFELLKVPAEKAKGKAIAEVKARVTGINAILGRLIAFEEAESALRSGFARALGMEFVEVSARASADEEIRAMEIAKEKFSNPAWTGRR